MLMKMVTELMFLILLINIIYLEKINPSKMEQKQICKDFYDKSSYDIFKVYKLASKSSKKRLKMN
ncbi:UPF0223 family protein [Apilactobacillus ozensis]|uniref:UPF0223 family protein n=1 Tax=Apilactobacillus ozensis TaxID=866801 RepID=UPI0034E1EAFE